MKLRFKEDPKEWRKAALLSLVGPSILAGILRWRGVVSWKCLMIVLGIAALIALGALIRPRAFRGYYRFMTWFGFHTIQLFGKAVLTLVFFVIVTPSGWILRLAGKDLLQTKSAKDRQTYWQIVDRESSLDRMF